MNSQAKGSFDVKVTTHPPRDLGEGLNVGHMTFRKKFQGDLEGTSVVEMLGMMIKEAGSGAYVALERVTGKLQGRTGSFCLQHSSVMTRGTPTESISIVPDSGTGELAGITGTLTIYNDEEKHFYDFDYTFENNA